jgi:adenylate cyclase 9
LYLCAGFGIVYSVLFELLSGFLTDMNDLYFIMARICLHMCIHLIGVHIFIMSQVRKRSTFLKVGQSIMSHSDLQVEKSLKQQMIHSLMPPQVAKKVMESRGDDQKREDAIGQHNLNNDTAVSSQLHFRSFHMDQIENVSILFADIVGFTRMSSNKTAEHLVSLLNDLFGRFDVICDKCGCEKISTLGDCYYCVSGCPTPRPDHATCCVEMGLAMCKAIQDFNHDHHEEVDMRVGVHTGFVLCGLVGTRRFKFDVWSHDVTLANIMESSGKPGRVHVSDQTLAFVKGQYEVEAGNDEQG